MQHEADVVVVGAGPAGLYSAMTAARMGAEVAVFEEHPEVGLPTHCAGHISIKGLRDLGLSLPAKVLENEIFGASFYSPSGYEFNVRLASPVTYSINRTLFDQELARLAERTGAEIVVGSKVESLILENGFVRGVALKNGRKMSCRVVVDAEGCSSHLLKQAGLQAFDRASAVVATNCDVENVEDLEQDEVEVYLTQKYAHGLFAWIIPRRDGSGKIGLATKSGNPRECLEQFFRAHPVAKRKVRLSRATRPSYHLIPLGGPVYKTYSNGFLAVGDVASQVKPTTGGGVIMGLTCAKIAGEIAGQAAKQGDSSENFLSSYQRGWKKEIGFDMAVMREIRSMLNKLPDSSLDRAIRLCSRWHLDQSLRGVKDIDFQGKALIPLLSSPATWMVVLYSFLASFSSQGLL